MPDILINSLELYIKNYLILIAASAILFTTSILTSYPLDQGIMASLVSFAIYIVITNKKTPTIYTTSKYFFAYLLTYLLYLLAYFILTLILVCILMIFAFFDIIISTETLDKLNLVAQSFIALYIFARCRIILAMIVLEKPLSLKYLINITSDKYYNWLIVIFIFYLPSIISYNYIENDIIKAALFGIIIPFTCCFNTTFYKSKI